MLAKAIAQGKLARLCMLGARVIAALGLMTTAIQVYILWQTYQGIVGNSYIFPGSPKLPVTYRSAPVLLDLLEPLTFLLGTFALTIFYALLLYVIARLLKALSAEETKAEEAMEPDEERIIFQSLDSMPKQGAPRFWHRGLLWEDDQEAGAVPPLAIHWPISRLMRRGLRVEVRS